ncbi:unnamed protein product [Paramecium sonneborni]|uniref:Uncharacterized protein n=1 Tax=Paramecium sonneborni TaxID=65129 RepID=A0A8S1QVQ3_9CILI|nr:unnamed protein product [Paramecium sonneborni]
MNILDENVLICQFQTQVDQLYRSMNQELLINLFHLANQTENELTLQIIGSLIATYIDTNHQEITCFENIYQGVFQIIRKVNSTSKPVYHFLGSILATIMFHFQDKLPTNSFNLFIQELLNIKPIAAFAILESVIRRLTPNHKLHKIAVITLDSQHRAVKNYFYKNNLELLLNSIMLILKNNYVDLIDKAISLFSLIMEGEFITDTKEKDFHKLRRADIKNNNSLQCQLSKFNPCFIEPEIQQLMIENSNIQWVDPTRSDIKRLWTSILDPEFIQLLLKLLPQCNILWNVLGKICKIFKKHFNKEQRALDLILFMTQEVQKLDITQIDIIKLFKFSCRTIYANTNQDWLMFNMQLFSKATTIEGQVQVFRFLREICRFYRQVPNSNKEYFSQLFIQIIYNFFSNWVLAKNEVLLLENQYYQNIRYNIKVITQFIDKQYFQFFQQFIAQNLNNLKFVIHAFDFLLLGFKSLVYSISYQLDVIVKLRHYQYMDRFLYPYDLDTFNQFNYQSFFIELIDILWKINSHLQSNGIQTKFYYYLWSALFDSDLLIKFEPIMQQIQIERKLFFDFAHLLTISDTNLLKKCLKLISNSKFRFERDLIYNNYTCTINNIMIPIECLSIFDHFQFIQDTELQELYYSIKCSIYNAQNEAFYNSEDCDNLLNKFLVGLNSLVTNIQDIQSIMFIFKSLLNTNGRFSYKQIMTMMWEQERFNQFKQFLSLNPISDTSITLLVFTRKMVSMDSVKSLRSEIVDQIYEWIYNLSHYYIDWLTKNNNDFNQERQLGEKSEKKIYQVYYRPIRKLLKLFVNFKFMRQCLTSKVKVKEQILQLIYKLLHLINLNDLNVLIHKMEPLYRVCEWLVESELTNNRMNPNDSHLILEFANKAIRIQEKQTFTLAIKIFEIAKEKPDILNKHYVLIQFILEDLLIAAYIYNQRVSEIGKILYNHLKKQPNLFDSLFVSIQQRVSQQKSPLWQQQFIQKASILKQQLYQKQDQFNDAFVQLQMLYNYLQ